MYLLSGWIHWKHWPGIWLAEKRVPVTALGEAADKYADKLTEAGITLAPPAIRCCRAGSVAMAAWNKLEKGKTESPLTVTPNYIRRSEAEVQWELRHREK